MDTTLIWTRSVFHFNTSRVPGTGMKLSTLRQDYVISLEDFNGFPWLIEKIPRVHLALKALQELAITILFSFTAPLPTAFLSSLYVPGTQTFPLSLLFS